MSLVMTAEPWNISGGGGSAGRAQGGHQTANVQAIPLVRPRGGTSIERLVLR